MSSSSKRRRRSKASTRSSASSSDSDGDLIGQVSPSNSQRHDDKVPQAANKHEGLGPDSQQPQTLQPLASTPSLPVEEREAAPVSSETTPPEAQQPEEAAQSPPKPQAVSPNTEDKVHRVKVESDRTGWGRISDLIRQYDRDRVEDVKEDIDTLLVLAGLFSAVVTAFIIESYKTLQQQPEDTTNQILLQLSAQIASLALSGNFVNSTIPAFTTPTFVPARFSVLINTLWLLSLVFALITASLGILVKQWLHELMARDTQDPRQQVKIRFFREVGVQRWQIFEIAAALPLLLQLALLLFFIGLSTFLHDLNPIVTWVVTGVMIPWLVFYSFTTFAPAFSSQCPYKTPMLKGFLSQVRTGLHAWPTSLSGKLHALIPTAWQTIKQQCEDLHDSLDTWSATWIAREEAKVRQDGTWDLPTLICSREILRGEQLKETITDCFQKFDMPTMLRCMKSISDGKGPDVRDVLPDVPQGFAEPVFKLYRSFMGTLISPSDNVFPHSQWYVLSTYALSRSYNPDTNWPIPELSLPLHVRLVNENQTSAVFSVLTMYSVRYNTIESHPERFDYLFLDKAYDDILYAVGARFASNLVAATRTLCRHLWNQFPVDSEINIENILYWINIAREDSDPDIPTDPIAFIFTFAQILYFLTPRGVRQEHREMIMGMMGELADVVVDVDGSSWSVARRYCAEQAFGHFFDMGLGDGRLIPRLGDVIRTWRSGFDHTKALYAQD